MGWSWCRSWKDGVEVDVTVEATTKTCCLLFRRGVEIWETEREGAYSCGTPRQTQKEGARSKRISRSSFPTHRMCLCDFVSSRCKITSFTAVIYLTIEGWSKLHNTNQMRNQQWRQNAHTRWMEVCMEGKAAAKAVCLLSFRSTPIIIFTSD